MQQNEPAVSSRLSGTLEFASIDFHSFIGTMRADRCVRARVCVLVSAEYGGIYLDTDVLVLKSFDPLRNYSTVMGRETDDKLNNGIIVARRGATFLRLMQAAYRSYRGHNESWEYTPVVLPHRLAAIFPDLIHIERTSIARPNMDEAEMRRFFRGVYDWSNNYCVHVWTNNGRYRLPSQPPKTSLRNWTLCNIIYYILYDKKLPGGLVC